MTTDEQLAALGRVAMRLQNENNALRDVLQGILICHRGYLETIDRKAVEQAEKALVIRYEERDIDPDRFDDSFMDRLSDDDTEEEES
jgi:hypothetical protein